MSSRSPRWSLAVGVAVTCGLALAAAACGDDAGEASYPDRAITWIIPFDPGGGSDVEARRLQPHIEEYLGVSVHITHRLGAGGAVGWTELVNSDPDGYTIGGVNLPHIIVQPMFRDDAGYETEDLVQVFWNVESPAGLLVHVDSPITSIDDFVSEVTANPGQVTVSGPGLLSNSHVVFAEMVESMGLDLVYVPEGEGAGAVITSLLGRHVDSAILGLGNAARNPETIRVLAITGDERSSAYPDVPTFAELGYEVTVPFALGVAVPRGTPDDIVATLGEAFRHAADRDEVREGILAEASEPMLIGPDEAPGYLGQFMERIEQVRHLLDE